MSVVLYAKPSKLRPQRFYIPFLRLREEEDRPQGRRLRDTAKPAMTEDFKVRIYAVPALKPV